MPETSVIIRTFNEEKNLGNLLRALQTQDYKQYEIIIVDSGSTDATLEIARQFNTKILSIESRDFTFGYSLNVGCKEAKGRYLVFASAHVLPVDGRWLGGLIEPFADEKVAMVYGRQMGDEGAKFSEKRDLRRLFGEKPFDSKTVIEYANNANAAVRKSLWEEHAFDEFLFGLEDIEWARWSIARGYVVHYAPHAAVYHIHREAWHQVFNRYRREAIAAARIGLPHPPQSRIEPSRFAFNLLGDIAASFPDWSPKRLEEIVRFRYYQWKGGRQGWTKDRNLDLDRDKYSVFFPQNSAVVITAPGHAALTDAPLPQLKPGDLLLRVEYVGICHTDLEVYDGTLGYYKDGLARYPIVPGHEYAGTIVQIGANNKYRERFKVGSLVVGECILSRGESGERREVGVINQDGAYAKLIVVPGDHVHKVENGLDAQTAALTEPLGVVLRGLRRLRPRLSKGASVAVVGAGPIGNFAAQVLAHEGYTVGVFDRNKERLALLGGAVASTNSEIKGLGSYDAVVEATGSSAALEVMLKESKVGAALLLLGFPYGDMKFNFESVVGGDREIIGSVGADREDFVRALELLPALDTKPFTRTVLPLEEFKEAWELLRSGREFKIMLKP